MLKNYLGKDANGIGARKSPSSEINCVRCSKGVSPCNSLNVAVACVNGHVQCFECDNSMRHQCKKCGIPTTSIIQHDQRLEKIDPKTLPPEELTQLELNAALMQFKLNFQKKFADKKKRLRLVEATSHIIELLNPSLIDLYKKGPRYSQNQVEKHFFRTSEKSQHSFAWHRAALDFVMDRTFDLKSHSPAASDGSILNVSYSIEPEVELLCKRSLNTNKSLNFLKKYTQRDKTFEANKKQKRKNSSLLTNSVVDEQVFDIYNNTEKLYLALSDKTSLICMKPNQWLNEVNCPHCGLVIRLSDFSKHFAIYHCLPIECMKIGESRRISLDPRILLNRGSYPHTLFLIRNMVRDLGGSEFRNLFPIVLTTATFQNDELFDKNDKACGDGSKPTKLMIWLNSICSNDEFKVCLKMISEHYTCLGQSPPLNTLYPITKLQSLNDIFESGDILLLPLNTFGNTNRRNLERIVLEITLEESIESNA